jgi:AraC-like DNA-binding protein
MKKEQKKIPYYDYYSLHSVTNARNGIENFFIFDDIHAFVEDFHFASIINYPIRLAMLVGIICKKGYFKLRIGLEDFTVTPNMILLIFPEQIFEATAISPDFEAGYVLLDKGFFDVQRDFKMALDLESYFLKQQCFQLSDRDMEEVMVIFGAIKRTVQDNTNMFSKEIVQAHIRILFYIACNSFSRSKKKVVKTRKEEIFEKFISLLNQHYRKERNIGWYAEQLCLTPKYLSKLVHETSGKHAGEWIRDYLILEARALLNSSSLTIQQISDELGFANQSHFGSYFKRYTGSSPRAYKYGKKDKNSVPFKNTPE